MKAYLKEVKFPSTDHTYIQDITDQVNDAIKKAEIKNGLAVINSKHTTLGILVNEIAEPNLLKDILKHTLRSVPEDKRSTRVHKDYEHDTIDYSHRCQDNPKCDEVDIDYNAASHIRSIQYSHHSVSVPIVDGKLELGKYQQVAVFEFDGRDGSGQNPIRNRTVQFWLYPADEIITL